MESHSSLGFSRQAQAHAKAQARRAARSYGKWLPNLIGARLDWSMLEQHRRLNSSSGASERARRQTRSAALDMSGGGGEISRLKRHKVLASAAKLCSQLLSVAPLEGVECSSVRMDIHPSWSGVLSEAYRRHIDNIRRPLESLVCKTPDNQEILLHKDQDRKIAILTIKSGSKNALSGRMISKLVEAVDELYQWREGKAVVLVGHGGTFCSGSDLLCVGKTATEEQGLQLAKVMQYTLMRIQLLPMVSVAYLEGYALGGGAELALAADLRVMSASARIGFVHIRVGVCCGWGGGSRLAAILGPSRALELFSSGRTVGATEALQLGLSNGTCASLDEALAFAAKHAVGSTATIGALKAMVNSTRLTEAADRSLWAEAQLYASTWGQPEHLGLVADNIKHNDEGTT